MTQPQPDKQPKPATFAEQILADDPELQERIAAQTAEYGTYRATSRIYAGNALAYDVGHPVPVSNVVKHGYFLNGQVELVDGAEHPPEMQAIIKPTAKPADVDDDEADVDDDDESDDVARREGN